jgi:hypothetical protein
MTASRPRPGDADHGRELGLDERLVDGLGGLADAVIDLRGRECIQDLQSQSADWSRAALRCGLREPMAWSR